ncbi:transposase [Salmonella enterica subsp. diarizonae]|nr:transposase [Salmonella enterica subsp. diarizonae]ECF5952035.1 transposase [Salmonella enterica subsp. diarizonae]
MVSSSAKSSKCRLQNARREEGNRNKTIRDFSESSLDELIVNYTPSEAVKSDLRKRKLLSEFPDITLRLIKHTDQNGEYIIATTLIESECYEEKDFHDLYHHRWSIEELYKLSKSIICIEDFHSQSEKGVKQEIQAHILLLNLARISENDINLRGNDNGGVSRKENKQKLNFKNCLFLIVRHLPLLIHGVEKHLKSLRYSILRGIAGMTQRVRPGRHYPRKSMRPRTHWNSFDAPART